MPRKLPRIRLFPADSVQSLANILPFHRSYFTLLLAWDPGALPREEIVRLFQPVADRGLAYFCAWGNRCEEVHDAVDQCVIPREYAGGPLNYITMTTWHETSPWRTPPGFSRMWRSLRDRTFLLISSAMR